MSFIGTVGVVAQQGNQAAVGPTGVSIKTDGTGSATNNACTTVEVTGLWHASGYSALFSETHSGSIHDIDPDDVATGYQDEAPGHPGTITFWISAYLEATGASTYSWDATINTEETSLSNSITAAIQGSSSDRQDGTGEKFDYTGFRVVLTLPTQGTTPETYAIPADGDAVAFFLDGTATDSSGNDTDAQRVSGTFRFVTP